MKITVLVENTSISKEYKNKHGLSLHIKTDNHSILFDLGPDETFIENARLLGINIEEVDTVIISHGHKDHGGGLKAFLEINKKARVYINKDAFEKHFAKVLGIFKADVGLDLDLEKDNRIVFIDDIYKIDDELMIFNKISSNELLPLGNKSLYKVRGNNEVNDDFTHEQNLIISSGSKKYLFAGCSHRGIVNILEEAKTIALKDLDYLISGFHLFNPVKKKYESDELINKISDVLNKNKTLYYTCHCTGEKGYEKLADTLGEKVKYIRTGQVLDI